MVRLNERDPDGVKAKKVRVSGLEKTCGPHPGLRAVLSQSQRVIKRVALNGYTAGISNEFFYLRSS